MNVESGILQGIDNFSSSLHWWFGSFIFGQVEFYVIELRILSEKMFSDGSAELNTFLACCY